MTDLPTPRPAVSRRSIAKGTAWAAPAIILSSTAPANASSPKPPAPTPTPTPSPTSTTSWGCYSCLQPIQGLPFTLQSMNFPVGSTTNVTTLTGTLNAPIDASACADLKIFDPIYTISNIKATLHMSDGQTSNNTLPLGQLAGGSYGPAGAIGGAFSFPRIRLKPGSYSAANNYNNLYPTKIVFTFTTTFHGLSHGIFSGKTISCPQTLTYNFKISPTTFGAIVQTPGACLPFVPCLPPTYSGTVNYNGYLSA